MNLLGLWNTVWTQARGAKTTKAANAWKKMISQKRSSVNSGGAAKTFRCRRFEHLLSARDACTARLTSFTWPAYTRVPRRVQPTKKADDWTICRRPKMPKWASSETSFLFFLFAFFFCLLDVLGVLFDGH
ncbi:hypothetical protein TYRP_009633 [Tyrophagus putrescentiae]|nr:hypothetical protein TYRP_009633 [Tyrophagus putrescentiae]